MTRDREPEIRADQLVEHATFVRSIARAILGRDDLADDAVQDAFTAALCQAPRERSRLRAWLGGIVRFKALEIRRREARRAAREGAVAPSRSSVEPAALAQSADMGRRVIERVLELPEPYRHVLLLRFHSGLSIRAVADLLDVPVETVRTRQRRALVRLREALDAHGEGKRDWRRLLVPLAGAGPQAGVGTVVAVLGGALMAKKIAAIAGVLLVLGGGAWWAGQALDGPPDGGDGAEPGHGINSAAIEDEAPPRLAGRPAAQAAPMQNSPASTTTGRYGGTLLDEQGRPVPDAWLQVVSAEGLGADARTMPRITPDEDGRFAFEIPGATAQVPVRLHSSTHVVFWGGRVRFIWPNRPAKFVLARAVTLGVRVLDEVTGRPVPQAKVGAYAALTRSPDALRQMQPKDEALTGRDGRAALRTRAGRGLLLVRATGYRAAMRADLDMPLEGQDVTIRLGRGGIVHGRVMGEAGAPIAGVSIEAMGFPSYKVQVTSDADGRFTLRDTPILSDPVEPVLRYHLRLWSQIPGSGTQPRFFRVEPPAGAGETAEVELTWYEGRSLSGRVRHADGTPAVGLAVTVKPRWALLSNWSASPTTTDSDGRFRFERCVPGLSLVQARQGSPTGASLVEQVVEFSTTGRTPDVELVLPRAAPEASPKLTVRLLTHDGVTLEQGTVHWSAMRGRGMTTIGAVVKEGRAELEEGVRPRLLLWADAPSYAPLAVRLTARDVARGHLDLRFPAGVVEGRVVRQDGAPVRLALRATFHLPRAGSPVPRQLEGHSELQTDEQGRFRLLGVGDGEYSLRVPVMNWRLVGGRVSARAGERDLRFIVGTESELHDLFVEAVLLDGETNAPLKGWFLLLKLVERGASAEGEPVALLQRVTGSASLFRTFHPVSPGVYDVVIARQFGRRETRVAGVRVGKGIARPRVTLTWDRGLSITGHVLDAQGEPAAKVHVSAGGRTVVAKKDGSYRVSGLEAGAVEVAVTGPYVQRQLQRVDVREGDGGHADFRVTTGGAIRLVPPAPWGPVHRLFVSATPESGGTAVTLDLTGEEVELRLERGERLSLPHLAPGHWQVDVDWDGRRIESKVVDVRDRVTTEIKLLP